MAAGWRQAALPLPRSCQRGGRTARRCARSDERVGAGVSVSHKCLWRSAVGCWADPAGTLEEGAGHELPGMGDLFRLSASIRGVVTQSDA